MPFPVIPTIASAAVIGLLFLTRKKSSDTPPGADASNASFAGLRFGPGYVSSSPGLLPTYVPPPNYSLSSQKLIGGHELEPEPKPQPNLAPAARPSRRPVNPPAGSGEAVVVVSPGLRVRSGLGIAPVLAQDGDPRLPYQGDTVAILEMGLRDPSAPDDPSEWWRIMTPGGLVGYGRAINSQGKQNLRLVRSPASASLNVELTD